MKKGQRAFTLIELMVVVAIIGTLVALVAPAFKRMIDIQRLRSINAALITDLQFARSEATSRNQIVRVKFDSSGGSLTCYVILTGDHDVCDCKNQPGVNVCGLGGIEIRSIQVDRSLGVTVAIPSSQTRNLLGFDPATGGLLVLLEDVWVPPPERFVLEVKNPDIGGFLDSLEVTGRPSVCSPAGQISGVVAC